MTRERSLGDRRRARDERYWTLSAQPLHALVFLAPLVVAYQIGSAVYLSGGVGRSAETIRAHRLLWRFFEAFGVSSVYLPGVALVVVLLVMHILRKDPWRVKPRALGGMLVESFAWAAPVLVMAEITGRALAAAQTTGAPVVESAARPLGESLTIAIGAGLYEELLFRMVAIAFFHFLLVDLVGAKKSWGTVGAVALAALAFGFYHDVWTAQGALEWGKLAFFVAAGALFGAIYAGRGFGVVVGAHAAYDVIVLTMRA